jgi:hypothetical protein
MTSASAFQGQIDPSLCDMSLADVNPALNLITSTSHDSGADGNSISGGEPVHRSVFFFFQTLTSFYFQLSPRQRRPSQTSV